MKAVSRTGRQTRLVQPYQTGASRRVYVGNLDWSVTWQDLKDHMKLFGGHVLHADILAFPDGRSKGCGIVEFSSVQEAQIAIERLNDSELKGRKIFLREDREDPAKGSTSMYGEPRAAPMPRVPGEEIPLNKKIVVENIPAGFGWQDLKDLAKPFGLVKRADVVEREREGLVGVLQFTNDEDATNAISRLNGQVVDGCVIRLRYEENPVITTSNKLYVGQLAWEVAWQDLKDHFKPIGPVVRADVATDSNGRSRGFGFVEFENCGDAARAVRELNDSYLKGRKIHVREDREV